MQEKYYTCRYDRAFKEVMLKKENENILKALLEKILQVEIHTIDVRSIERNAGNIKIKRKYFDALLKTNVGSIGIEINSDASKKYVKPRNFGYFCDMYASYVRSGEEYDTHFQIIQINFNYNTNEETDIEDPYYMQNKKGKKYVPNAKIIDVNMEKYKRMWYSKSRKAIEENKLIIMLDLKKEELLRLSKEDKVVMQYMEELDRINENVEFREFMTHEEDLRKIHNTEMREAKESGLEEGIKSTQLEIIHYNLEQGKTKEEIASFLNMSIDDLEKLLESKNI